MFNFQKLTRFDLWYLLSYALLSVVLFTLIDLTPAIVFGYSFLTQLFLYVFCYKSLRNFYVFIIWLGIGFCHSYLHYILINDNSLRFVKGHAAMGLKNTLPLLLLFQVLRVLSLKIQRRELVSPSRGSTTDIFDEVKITWLDYVLFLIYGGL